MKKRLICAILSAMLIISFTACSQQSSENTQFEGFADSSNTSDDSNYSVNVSNLKDGKYDLSFTKRDSDASYNENSADKITFTNSSAESSSSLVEISKTEVTIKSEGTYILSGSCDDGKVIVDADDKEKVQIVLNGLDITSSGCPFVVKSADKVFITLADGSKNAISDGSEYTEKIEDTNIDAAIFSKEDLSINGSGSLTVNGNYKHGILSKDDLVIAGGTISVTSASTAIEGKDSLKIKDSDLTVTAGSDGLRSTNIDNTDTKGFVYINSGTINITADNDAIQSSSLLRIDGGNFTITTGGGSESGKTHTERDFGMWMFSPSSDSEDTESAKGIKSADTIKVNGGTLDINSSDDALHSNGSLIVNGGKFEIETGDDGMHADDSLTIEGGTINITKSYEGIEAGEVTVNDGNISVVASDDGFNAAGGNNGGNRGGDMFGSDVSKQLTINGGYIYVDADGDGLDSNGMLVINGGTILVNGPSNNGNGAIDYEISGTITGGTLIAIGASGMAESVTGDGQCSIITSIDSQTEGTTCALVDSSGNAIASITSTKSFNSVVVSSPAIKTGESYTIVCGASVDGADENGYTSSGKISGGSTVAEITMDSENYSSGSGMMGGMGGMSGRPDGMGGRPDGMGDQPGGMRGGRPKIPR